MKSGKFVGLLNVGFRRSHLIMVRDGLPYYVRDFAMGGRDFTYALQMGDQVTWEEAERRKLTHDSLLVHPSIEPFLGKFAREVARALAYFRQQFASEELTVERLFLSGGTSRLKGFDQYLTNAVGIPTQVDDAIGLSWLPQSDKKEAGCYKVAIGLALEE